MARKIITERRKEILELIAEGYNMSQIAERLSIGKATVKTHISEMFLKYRLSNQRELVAWGFRNGVLK